LFGSVFEPKGDSIRYFTKCSREYGDIVFFRFLGVPACYVNRPDYIESVLVTQNNNFVKSKDYRAMRRVLGNGLLLSEGEFWRRQRKLIQPAFHQARIAAYAEIMVGHTQRMLASWSDGQTLDIHEAMMHLTLGIVAKTLFDAEYLARSGRCGRGAGHLDGKISAPGRPRAPFALMGSAPHVAAPAARRRALDKVIYGIIERRCASGQMSGDLLSVFSAGAG
jgi:cytochrome P450